MLSCFHALNTGWSPEIICKACMWERKCRSQLLQTWSHVFPASLRCKKTEYSSEPIWECSAGYCLENSQRVRGCVDDVFNMRWAQSFEEQNLYKYLRIKRVAIHVGYAEEDVYLERRDLRAFGGKVPLSICCQQKHVTSTAEFIHHILPPACSTLVPPLTWRLWRFSCCSERIWLRQCPAAFFTCERQSPEYVSTQLFGHSVEFMSENSFSVIQLLSNYFFYQ